MILQSFLKVFEPYDKCFLICSSGFYNVDLSDSPFTKESWHGFIRDCPKIYKQRKVLKVFNVPFSHEIHILLA